MEIRVDTRSARKDIRKALERFTVLLQGEIIKKIPSRFRRKTEVRRGKVYTIEINDEIFKFWEYPTKAHDIRPKFSSVLKFKWPDHPADLPPAEDGFHYMKKVRHPGTEGHFVLKNLTEDKRLMRKLLRKALR